MQKVCLIIQNFDVCIKMSEKENYAFPLNENVWNILEESLCMRQILFCILFYEHKGENTASEEPGLVIPHQSQEFSMVGSAGQALWEGWGWCFTGAALRSQQNHQSWKEQRYLEIVLFSFSFLLFFSITQRDSVSVGIDPNQLTY